MILLLLLLLGCSNATWVAQPECVGNVSDRNELAKTTGVYYPICGKERK